MLLLAATTEDSEGIRKSGWSRKLGSRVLKNSVQGNQPGMSGQGARPGGVHGLGELGSGGSVQASLGQEDRGRRDESRSERLRSCQCSRRAGEQRAHTLIDEYIDMSGFPWSLKILESPGRKSVPGKSWKSAETLPKVRWSWKKDYQLKKSLKILEFSVA